MNEAIAWINGSLCSFSQAAVPVWDLGVVAGASVTEMARTFAHQPFRLEQHVRRLTTSLEALGFPQPWSFDALFRAALGIVDHNTKLIEAGEDLGIVLFSTAGSNRTYLNGCATQTTTVVHTFVLPFAGWKSSFINGVRLQIPSVRQIPEDCFPVTHKVRNRLHWWLADQEASRREAGSRALLLDHQDFVTETSTSCFYLVHDDHIVTSSRGVLNSLSSQIVEEIACSLQIPFVRRPISVAELSGASEAFLSSTPVGLLPVSHIDGTPTGTAMPGPVFRRLTQAWSQLVGVDIAAQITGEAQQP